jgi:glycosyltransferase involved in cell wall biosynthesis
LELAVPVFRIGTLGGIERYILEVCTHIARRGHDVTFYGPGRDMEHLPSGTRGVAVGRGRIPNSISGAWDLVTFGARASTRVLMRQRRAVCYGPQGAVLVPGVITAMSVHAQWVRDRVDALGGPPPSPFDRALMATERLSYSLPYLRLTALSPLCADGISACYGVDRSSITVVTPAIDPDEFRPHDDAERDHARRAVGVPNDRFVVGIAANHAFERKRVASVIRACAKADRTVLVAGVEDRSFSQYQQLANDVRADVRFLGSVASMSDFYAALDVFTLPSINEAYGMALHEAMACGVATVSSDRCGIAQLFDAGNEGLVVDHRSDEALAAAFDDLEDDVVRARVAAAGLRWARRRTWEDASREIEAVLTESA